MAKSDRIREEHVKKTLETIQSIENMVDKPFYDIQKEEEISVKIRVSKNVPAAMFKPDPLVPNGWIANELTFRALKKDIFALGDEIAQELTDQYQCHSCKQLLDKQFWHFCPHCGSEFLK